MLHISKKYNYLKAINQCKGTLQTNPTTQKLEIDPHLVFHLPLVIKKWYMQTKEDKTVNCRHMKIFPTNPNFSQSQSYSWIKIVCAWVHLFSTVPFLYIPSIICTTYKIRMTMIPRETILYIELLLLNSLNLHIAVL